jgi:hypothetical protein
MSSVANDGTLVRGSIALTINSVVYTLLNYSRTGGAPRTELDYDANGKPAASNVAEDFERITGVIRMRSDKATPPKFTVFSYDSKNWQIISCEESGSTEGLKEYSVEILEVVNGSVTIS